MFQHPRQPLTDNCQWLDRYSVASPRQSSETNSHQRHRRDRVSLEGGTTLTHDREASCRGAFPVWSASIPAVNDLLSLPSDRQCLRRPSGSPGWGTVEEDVRTWATPGKVVKPGVVERPLLRDRHRGPSFSRREARVAGELSLELRGAFSENCSRLSSTSKTPGFAREAAGCFRVYGRTRLTRGTL